MCVWLTFMLLQGVCLVSFCVTLSSLTVVLLRLQYSRRLSELGWYPWFMVQEKSFHKFLERIYTERYIDHTVLLSHFGFQSLLCRVTSSLCITSSMSELFAMICFRWWLSVCHNFSPVCLPPFTLAKEEPIWRYRRLWY